MQSTIKTANIAKAKVVYNKNKEVYTIVCAFNIRNAQKKVRGSFLYVKSVTLLAETLFTKHCKQTKSAL